MDEAHYLARHSELATQLSVRAVAGTYEERLPLDLHATLALGCCAVVASQDAKGRALSREFSMAEMAMKVPQPKQPPLTALDRSNTPPSPPTLSRPTGLSRTPWYPHDCSAGCLPGNPISGVTASSLNRHLQQHRYPENLVLIRVATRGWSTTCCPSGQVA